MRGCELEGESEFQISPYNMLFQTALTELGILFLYMFIHQPPNLSSFISYQYLFIYAFIICTDILFLILPSHSVSTIYKFINLESFSFICLCVTGSQKYK